jgi:hypothetical protein
MLSRILCLAFAAGWLAGTATAVDSAVATRPIESAQSLLVEIRRAYGNAKWNQSGVLVLAGSEQASGLEGRWRAATDTASGATHESVDFGPYRLAETVDELHDWRQDHSGGVHELNSAFARAHATTERWLSRRQFLAPGLDGARVEGLAPATDAESRYERLRVTPRDGQPVELWFDARSHLLARSIWINPIDVTTTRYDDYRRVGSAWVPFKVTNDTDGNLEIIAIASAEFVAKQNGAEFAIPRTPDDATITGESTTVPITYDGDVIVEAKLNGQGPFAFILDTGGHDILTPQAAKALGLATAGAGVSGGAGEGTLTEQYTRVDRMQIGAATLRDQSFFVIPLQFDTVERGAKAPLAGILGLELFERFAVELDYRAQTLALRSLATSAAGHGIEVPITFTDDQPIFRARINGIDGDNGLDTGNSGSLVVQGRWAQANGLAGRMRKGLLTAGFGAGGISKNWASRVDLEVAGVAFPGTIARYAEDRKGAFSSRTEAGNVGNEIYENFRLTFDYRRGLVWFDPVPGAQPMRPVFPRAGLSVYKEAADAFTVATVLPGSPAAKAGIVTGDRIIAVNDVAASELSYWDWRRCVRQPVGTVLRLRVAHHGVGRSAELALAELLP